MGLTSTVRLCRASNTAVQETVRFVFPGNYHGFIGVSNFCVLIILGNPFLYSVWLSSDISLLTVDYVLFIWNVAFQIAF